MSHVRVSLHDLAAGDLPPVCVKTGVDCATSCRVRFSNRPAAGTWLQPYSWYVDVDAGRFPHRAVLGILPMTAKAHRRVTRSLTASRVTAGAGAALAGGAAAAAVWLPSGDLALGLASGALSLLATAAVLRFGGYASSVGGRIEAEGNAVRLTGVHPRFAEAVRRWYDAKAGNSADESADVRILTSDELMRRRQPAAAAS
jgi:hypothetical protein